MQKTLLASIIILVLSAFGRAWADTPPADPEVARLLAETARLQADTAWRNAQAANITARYGPAATAYGGNIADPGKFSALGHWTLSAATVNAADAIAKAMAPELNKQCSTANILITSTEDRRASALNAEIVDRQLGAFTETLLDALKPPSIERMELLNGANAIQGLVGTVDSLVGLLRANYAFSDFSVSADDLSLRIKVAAALRKLTDRPIFIEGLASPRGTSALISDYEAFFKARQGAQKRYAAELAQADTTAKQTALGGLKALLDAAATLDAALTTPAAGQVPLVQLALAHEDSGRGACVLYVKFAVYSASIVTRKRLLSRNDGIAAIAGGSVHMAVFDPRGLLLAFDELPIDERISAKLSEVVDSARPLEAMKPQTPEK